MPRDRYASAVDSSADLGLRGSLGALALERLFEDRATFRSPAIARDALRDLVGSPAAPATRRAAAGYFLGEDLDDATRARLRVLAESCVSPRLRVAVEAIVAGAATVGTLRAIDEEEGDEGTGIRSSERREAGNPKRA
jgi:hypothetical protein